MLFVGATDEVAIALDDLTLVGPVLARGLDPFAGFARFALHLGETVLVLRGSGVTRAV
jgi:hypothetical protein